VLARDDGQHGDVEHPLEQLCGVHRVSVVHGRAAVAAPASRGPALHRGPCAAHATARCAVPLATRYRACRDTGRVAQRDAARSAALSAMPSRMSCSLVTTVRRLPPERPTSARTRATTADHTRAPAPMTSMRP